MTIEQEGKPPIEHEPDCAGFRDDRGREEGMCESICLTHMKCEPIRSGDFRACGECRHVFRTPSELVALHMFALHKVDRHAFIRPAATDIAACPLCAHDF